MPVFMIIMGYFMARNEKPVLRNVLRGVKVFIVGFFLNIGLNFHLLLKIKFADWPYNPLEYIFGIDILYLAGLSIVILSVLKTAKKASPFIAVTLFFAITGLTSLMNEILMVPERNYIFPFIAGTYSWSYFPLFPWLAYPLAGFAFYHWEEKIILFVKQYKIIFGILLSVVAVVVLYFGKTGFSNTVYLPEYYHHTFYYAMWALGIIILWVTLIWVSYPYIFSFAPVKLLMWLGKNITLFYVIQWLIIGNIATAIYQTQSINKYVIWVTGIFSASVLLTWMLEKTHIKLAR